MSRTLQWCVTLCCRLLVFVRSLHLVVLVFKECLELCGGVLLYAVGCLFFVQSLRLVILVFEECLELRGGVLLYAVGCLFLCDRYVWSYWFPNIVLLFMHIALLVAVIFWLSTGLLGLYKRKFFHFSTLW